MFKLKEKFKTRKRLNLENIYEMLYQSLSLNQEKISKLEIEPEIYLYNNNIYFSFNKDKLIDFGIRYLKINNMEDSINIMA